MESYLNSLASGLDIHRHSDWVVFANRLESAIASGHAVRIQKMRTIYAPSEEWYLDPSSGDIYVYLMPDDRVLPEWAKVDVFAEKESENNDPKDITTSGLGAIPTGRMDAARTASLKYILQRMAQQGEVEVLSGPGKDGSHKPETDESTYREVSTGFVYRLVENPENKSFFWYQIPAPLARTYVQ